MTLALPFPRPKASREILRMSYAVLSTPRDRVLPYQDMLVQLIPPRPNGYEGAQGSL
jgi:hypothetical protein